MLDWIRKLVVPGTEVARPEAEAWIAEASNPADVESRLLRWEQRAAEYGLRLP